MERHIITLDERGTLHVPEAPGTSIWMDEPEHPTKRNGA